MLQACGRVELLSPTVSHAAVLKWPKSGFLKPLGDVAGGAVALVWPLERKHLQDRAGCVLPNPVPKVKQSAWHESRMILACSVA